MFNAATYKRMYNSILGPLAQEVIILLNNGTGFTRQSGVMAHVSAWKESELVVEGSIKIGDLKLIIRSDTLPAGMRDLEQKDRIEIDGRSYAVINWDTHTRSIGDEGIAVQAAVRG